MTRARWSRPLLILFASTREKQSRRAAGDLAQVLQGRGNRRAFRLRYVAREERPELLERFRIDRTPTLVVLQDTHVIGRLSQPRGSEEIQRFLAPWLE